MVSVSCMLPPPVISEFTEIIDATETRAKPDSTYQRPPASGGGFVPDVDDHVGALTAGERHADFLVEAFSHECACERGVHADVAARHVELVRAHDSMRLLAAVVVL